GLAHPRPGESSVRGAPRGRRGVVRVAETTSSAARAADAGRSGRRRRALLVGGRRASQPLRGRDRGRRPTARLTAIRAALPLVSRGGLQLAPTRLVALPPPAGRRWGGPARPP